MKKKKKKRIGDDYLPDILLVQLIGFVVMSHKVKTDLMSFGVKEIW